MFPPKQAKEQARGELPPGTTVALQAGTAAGKAAEARVSLCQLPPFGDRRQTGADKQKKMRKPVYPMSVQQQ